MAKARYVMTETRPGYVREGTVRPHSHPHRHGSTFPNRTFWQRPNPRPKSRTGRRS